MTREATIFAFTTSNYDAMIQFFKDLGMKVNEKRTPLCPLFNSGRGAFVTRGDIAFNLEESTSGPAIASFNVLFTDGFTDADIKRLQQLAYSFSSEASLYGTFHTIKSPDGGTVMICT